MPASASAATVDNVPVMSDASMSVDDRLRSDRNAWVVTVRPDGSPHVTPVWFVHVRGRFWIGTGLSSVKTRNVATNPMVSVTLEDGGRPVVAEGTVTVHATDRPTDVVAAFVAKYDWDVGSTEDADIGTLVLWEIVVDRWLMGAPGR